jgi:hypothetical protein
MNGGFNNEFDGRLDKAAREYNQPPETPREAMWSRIQAERAERSVRRMPKPIPIWRSPRMWVPAAAAAMLLIGIAIGRLSTPDDIDRMVADHTGGPGGDTSAETREGSPTANAYQLAAIPVLGQAELLFTQFRTGEAQEENGEMFSKRAASLLADTRLLLDSPAAEDPQMRRLLGDLELVLVQMVRMSTEDEKEEKELITESINHRSLLPRLRSNAAAGPYINPFQGGQL